MDARTDIALVTIPAFSHQVSILEFAKRLVHLHQDFHVTCIIPSLGSPSPASKSIFEALPPTIDCILLPPVNVEDGVSIEVQLQLAMSRSMPFVGEALKSLGSSTKLVALIADAIAAEALEFGRELNILSYVYFACSTMLLSMCLSFLKLDETISCEYRDHPEPIEIPGCISVHGIDLPDSVQDRSNPAYKLFLHRCQQYHLADGILVNSFVEMEAGAIRALQQEGSGNPAVYQIGPVTQSGPSSDKIGGACLRWLDNQPPNSVLYISFGSGGTLSQEQINELALGLELSSHKFLWANMRSPNNKASATYLSADIVDPLHFLPSGFLERTKGQGLVISSWAPQSEVLSHKSVGAFLTHCGWNSVLESIVQGVSLIAWPLFAEQRTNAAMLTDDLKVALRPKLNNDGIVAKEEIAKVIKSLTEGSEGQAIRRRMKELKNDASDALTKDGSSTKTLSQLAFKWKSLGIGKHL